MQVASSSSFYDGVNEHADGVYQTHQICTQIKGKKHEIEQATKYYVIVVTQAHGNKHYSQFE